MKTVLFILFALTGALPVALPVALLIALPSLALPSVARALGFENGNGGDTFAAEFMATAQQLIPYVKALAGSGEVKLDAQDFARAVARTSVYSTEHIVLRNREVDAINIPEERTIGLNRSRWRPLRLPSETRGRLKLVLHEYFGIMGLDDGHYVLSGAILKNIDTEQPELACSLAGGKLVVIRFGVPSVGACAGL